ncbi:MAG: hypothetical protein PHV36_10685 [Elusimicrobiales bacterium]|nr:hypothetical protein [Elusimicrobiales bacterium]
MPKKTKFSEYFKLNKSQAELDFVDVPIKGDIPLFIDPFAIHHREDRLAFDCHNTIVDFFGRVLRSIQANKKDEALELLSYLREPNQTHLGLSKGSVSRGRGVGGIQAEALLDALTRSKAIKTGLLKDLEDCALLVEDLASDKISDITTNLIRKHLIEYTVDQCELWGVPCDREVSAGYVWVGGSVGWQPASARLPICNGRVVLLIPKAFVQWRIAFNSYEYYKKDVLEFIQNEHLTSNSSLVRLLKSGKRKGEQRPPYKKTLEGRTEYRYSKDFLNDFSAKNIKVLDGYRKNKEKSLTELSEDDLHIAGAGNLLHNEGELIAELKRIPAGNKSATDYHRQVFGLLEVIFSPSLNYPRIEAEIDQGRKRVDIIFTNAGKQGFFSWLNKVRNIPCAYIFIECKNYSDDPGNPELDQLLGRFNVNNGKFGFIMNRRFVDKRLFIQRCRDAASKGRGHVIPLDDADVEQLLRCRLKGQSEVEHYLGQRFYEIDN